MVVAEVGAQHQGPSLAAVKIRVAAFAVRFGTHIRRGMVGRLDQVMLGTDGVSMYRDRGIHAVVTAQAQLGGQLRLRGRGGHCRTAVERESLRRLGPIPKRRTRNGGIGIG